MWINRHRSITRPFCEDPGSHMISMCHRKANKVWQNIEKYENEKNIKYYRVYRLKQEKLQATRLIIEIIWLIDAIDKETKYIKKKYPALHDIIDKEARNYFNTRSTIISI